MANETELKYIPPESFSGELLFDDDLIAPYFSEKSFIYMKTEYLDTPESAAAKQGITLRRRFENGKSIIYAKTSKSRSGALSLRGEWSVESSDIKNAAALLSNEGAPTENLISLPLSSVASVEFHREECLVSPYDGFSFMLSFDEGLFGGKVPFREIELELSSGSTEELIFYGEKLSQKLQLRAEERSKYARALEYGNL